MSGVPSTSGILHLSRLASSTGRVFGSRLRGVPTEFTEVDREAQALADALQHLATTFQDDTVITTSNAEVQAGVFTIIASVKITLNDLQSSIDRYTVVQKRKTRHGFSVEKTWSQCAISDYRTLPWVRHGGDLNQLRSLLIMHCSTITLLNQALQRSNLDLEQTVLPLADRLDDVCEATSDRLDDKLDDIHDISMQLVETSYRSRRVKSLEVLRKPVAHPDVVTPPYSEAGSSASSVISEDENWPPTPLSEWPPRDTPLRRHSFSSLGSRDSNPLALLDQLWPAPLKLDDRKDIVAEAEAIVTKRPVLSILVPEDTSETRSTRTGYSPVGTLEGFADVFEEEAPAELRFHPTDLYLDSPATEQLTHRRCSSAPEPRLDQQIELTQRAAVKAAPRQIHHDSLTLAGLERAIKPTPKNLPHLTTLQHERTQSLPSAVSLLATPMTAVPLTGPAQKEAFMVALFRDSVILFDGFGTLVQTTVESADTDDPRSQLTTQSLVQDCRICIIRRKDASTNRAGTYRTSIWTISTDFGVRIQHLLPEIPEIVPYSSFFDPEKVSLTLPSVLQYHGPVFGQSEVSAANLVTTNWTSYTLGDETSAASFQSALYGRKLLHTCSTEKTTLLHSHALLSTFTFEEQIAGMERLRLWSEPPHLCSGGAHGVAAMLHASPNFAEGWAKWVVNGRRIRVVEKGARAVEVRGLDIVVPRSKAKVIDRGGASPAGVVAGGLHQAAYSAGFECGKPMAAGWDKVDAGLADGPVRSTFSPVSVAEEDSGGFFHLKGMWKHGEKENHHHHHHQKEKEKEKSEGFRHIKGMRIIFTTETDKTRFCEAVQKARARLVEVPKVVVAH